MSGATLAGIADGDFPSPSGEVFVAVALKSTSISQNPSVASVTFDVDSMPANMVLQLNALDTTAVPVSARVLAVLRELEAISLNEDLVVSVSRDDGEHWDAVPLARVADFLTNKAVVEGTVTFSHADGGGRQVLHRVETANNKSLEVHFVTLGAEIST
ncbi:MAG: hypothetical protein KKB70_07210 [Proteobacteria bacterium]|nr:hypothetical protein [Pseudomonadota bacterium]MBU1611836.1 hypothetical protein [Pseudomonadota bacterium]